MKNHLLRRLVLAGSLLLVAGCDDAMGPSEPVPAVDTGAAVADVVGAASLATSASALVGDDGAGTI